MTKQIQDEPTKKGTLRDIQEKLEAVEIANAKLPEQPRITKVWATAGDPLYVGLYGSAPVEEGKPAYQLSTGEVIDL